MCADQLKENLRRARTLVALCLLCLYLMGGSLAAGEKTINSDADLYCKLGSPTTNFGGENTIYVRKSGGGSHPNTYLGVIRFDNYKPIDITAADLLLDLNVMEYSSCKFHIYGVTDGSALENFDESTSGYGDFSPPMNGSGDGVDVTSSDIYGGTRLGYLVVSSTDLGQTVSFTSTSLVNFLNADTNGVVVFIVSLWNNGVYFTGFASKEAGSLHPPRLVVESSTNDSFETIVADSGGTAADSNADTLTVAGGGIVSTAISGDTLTISATEADGDATNELQDLFKTINGDSGSTTANSLTDSLNVVGAGSVATSVVGDTLTITGNGLLSEVDGDTTNELQNLFANISSDSGSTSANALNDTLIVSGGGIVSTAISGDTLTISAIEADGDATNELQNLFSGITGDSGTTTADSQTDTLNFAGAGLVSTSVSGDTVTISAAIGNDALDFDQLADNLTADASTAFDLDTNDADLDFDNQTLYIDSSTNRVGLGTATPAATLHLADGNLLQTPGGLNVTGSVSVGTPGGADIAWPYAFVLDSQAVQLNVVDISDPVAPSLVGAMYLGSDPTGISVRGRYAYVLDAGYDELWVIDVADPASPVQVGSLAIGGDPRALDVAGRYAYLVDTTADDLKIIDVTDPAGPSLAGSLSIGGEPQAVQVSGSHAYVVDGLSDDLKIIDVADPSAPSLAGSLSLGNYPQAVAVSGRYAYVLDSQDDEMDVIDVSDPGAPSLTGSVAVGNYPWSISLAGRYAYVADVNNADLRIVDVADPSAPAVVTSVHTGNAPWVQVLGSHAYVVDRDSKNLKVVDITGVEATSAVVHALEAGNLAVHDDISAGGNLRVQGGANIGAGGLFSGGDIALSGVLAIANDVAPTSSPANLVQLYAEDQSGSSELRVRDEAGNVTTLSPHNFSLIGKPSEPLAWAYYSENGQGKINVDMLRAMRLIERHFGEKLVYEEGFEAPPAEPGLSHRQRIEQLEAENEALRQENAHMETEIQRIKAALHID